MWHKRNIWYSKEVFRQLRLQECAYEERSVTQMNHLRLPLNEEGLGDSGQEPARKRGSCEPLKAKQSDRLEVVLESKLYDSRWADSAKDFPEVIRIGNVI